MTEELFLIAHKVRSAPAFDVAIQMPCPMCEAGCNECEQLGYWWIIPTSGHRAYPSTYMHLDCVTPAHVEMMKHSNIDNIRDHYTTSREPARSRIDITNLLSPPVKIQRRF